MKHHYNKEELVELKRKYDMQVSKEALEEIEDLKEDKSKMFETAVKRNNQLLDRIDKAIEYVKNNVIQIKLNEVGTVTTVSEKFDKDEFLDILQGSDKE